MQEDAPALGGPDPDVERNLGPGGATVVHAEGLGGRSGDAETHETGTDELEHRETGTDELEHREVGTDELEQPTTREHAGASDLPEDDQPTSVRGVPVTADGSPVQDDTAVDRDETPAEGTTTPGAGWRPSGLYRTPRSLSRDDPEQRG